MKAILIVVIVCVYNALTTYAAVPKPPAMSSRITFPDSEEDAIVPDPCKDLTYCTIKPKDYPDEKFREMFKDYKTVKPPRLLVDLDNRFGNPDEEDNCASEVTYEPPYQVRPKREKPWMYVIQVPEKNITQQVRIERCKNPEAPCFTALGPANEITTYCKQKVNTWEFLVANGKNGTDMVKVDLPVCCSCYKRGDYQETLMGFSWK